ncbi:MAG TPA: hypothetical protein VK212_03080 [Lentimicrobium sp.]|nr:hypothetical protein [Lentimicrobium sp.]
MKQYSHAWLAFMAIKRLEKTLIPEDQKKYALSLTKWFKDHRDSVIQGAWYPDAIIKDMATSHVIKYKPDAASPECRFRKLPDNYNLFKIGKTRQFYLKPYIIDGGNLPDRCEAIAHSIVDNLKMQESEEKGSPISPSNNHIATLFFMLSHYIADAHMPLHCDARSFSEKEDIHACIEKYWDEAIKDCFEIDKANERFFYDPEGYPLRKKKKKITEKDLLINWLEQELISRPFSEKYGPDNDNTWDFMAAITQYSYLTAYKMIPQEYNEDNLDWATLKSLDTGMSFEEYSRQILMDSIDSIARVWFRVWRRYQEWAGKKKGVKTPAIAEPVG